ncbi:MAG: hypothetical protein M1832_001021 [Thelocarpon impressellum]|nr:MAG: hypothetical protein M1832_001021 [Thelocarpon impressellum]
MAQEYRLKIDSLDLRNGEKREAEVDGIEHGKVLLVKLRDEVHALSPNCTHYGAPMVKGVVTGDGRLTCPWHGACFNVASGDVEDSPALDPLAKFQVTERDGAVYITGDEATIKAGRISSNVKCEAEGQEKVVIVGGGSGTIGALESLRKNGYKGAITVISREPYPPIDRTKLSKALMTDIAKLAWRDSAWYESASIDIINDEVTEVKFADKTVSTKSGKSHPYTKLILATGGTPRRLPLPGFDLDNVFVLRTVPDAEKIVAAVGESKKKKIVVIGSSFIGMEVANCLAKENEVTVVGMEKVPLERVMGAEVGKVFRSALEKNGVKFYMEAGVDKAGAALTDSSKVGSVFLKDGTQLPADLVILGVGVAPATEFLKGSQEVQLEKDGSVKTDERFAVEGLRDVWAIGDIATYPYHGPGGDGRPTRIEHWNVAQNAGRSVGFQIGTGARQAKSFIPIFWSALGSQLRYCGNTVGGYDDLVLQGKPDEGTFAAFYARGETIVAVASMQMDPIMSHSAELMRRGKMPSKSELRGGADVLKVAVPAAVEM